MRKVALVFVLAVIVPSLVLAWLAIRTLRDQQFLIERQTSLLYQGVADGLSKNVQDAVAEDQRTFTAKLTGLLRDRDPQDLAKNFDEVLRKEWPLAQVGFVVTTSGRLVSPTATSSSPDARTFRSENSQFLLNRETAEVYWNQNAVNLGIVGNNASAAPDSLQSYKSKSGISSFGSRRLSDSQAAAPSSPPVQEAPAPEPMDKKVESIVSRSAQNRLDNNRPEARKIVPQQRADPAGNMKSAEPEQLQEMSKIASSEAEFRQLVGDATEGTLARFVNNKLNVLIWSRSTRDTNLIFGAQLSVPKLIGTLAPLIQGQAQDYSLGNSWRGESSVQSEICAALLDDNAKPVALSHPGFTGNWKRPFVATEIGEVLPHWEVAIYLLNPGSMESTARTLKLTLGLLIATLITAIAAGSWLIVTDLNRQLKFARQKTDFVSNVSHEIKTPLTSIRMFSELLSEGRVTDPEKQRSYLGIITAETARLSRLINNVLDFARIERGEKKYKREQVDLTGLVREMCETFRTHLEASGFKFECHTPDHPVPVSGDRDALAQVLVNLLSNAEKYSGDRKEIEIRLEEKPAPLSLIAVNVLDRGLGVPRGEEEKIFGQFYRAHDSLSSGIQGSGLGLTLAREIARAHGGNVTYERRDGGGSCFKLQLPLGGMAS